MKLHVYVIQGIFIRLKLIFTEVRALVLWKYGISDKLQVGASVSNGNIYYIY